MKNYATFDFWKRLGVLISGSGCRNVPQPLLTHSIPDFKVTAPFLNIFSESMLWMGKYFKKSSSFLALHLRWASIVMTWRPSSSSSVDNAHFVTARAISMKLGVRIPLGNTPRASFDFRDLTYFVVYRRPSWKFTKFLWVVYLIKTTSHITRVLDLAYFSRSQRSKV
jgi:hypothetical protein